jgi:hypothetical protein
MKLNRRQILVAIAAALAAPRRLFAIGGLEGQWVVRCQNGHDNTVTGITVNHTCETSGCGLKSVSDGEGWVVCPANRDHCDWVDGVTRQHECETCGTQCRRD